MPIRADFRPVREHLPVHSVAVVGERSELLAAGGRPPSPQLGPGVVAGVGGELGEEFVDTQQVRQVGPVGQLPPPLPRLVPARCRFTALTGDDIRA
jgi:hypothetical protein